MRILLIAPGQSYRTGAYLAAGRRLDIQLCVAAFGEHPIAPPGEGLKLTSDSQEAALDQIVAAAKQTPFDAFIPTDDSTVRLAAAAASYFGHSANSSASAQASVDKSQFRKRCRASGLLAPDHRTIKKSSDLAVELIGVKFPCVAKPVSLSASRGVIRCNDVVELHVAISRIRTLLDEELGAKDDEILIEDYLEGAEYAIDGVLSEGRLEILAVFEKPDALSGPFFEETIYLTPPRLPTEKVNAITAELDRLCGLLGFVQGAIHAECRLTDAGVFFVEVASRTVGGRCGRILEFELGISLEELVLRNALELPWSRSPSQSASGVMMIPVPESGVLRRVEGISSARAVQGVVEVEVDCHEGQVLRRWPEGGPYPGFIYARGKSPDDVEVALREAHRRLRFVTAPVFRSEVNIQQKNR